MFQTKSFRGLSSAIALAALLIAGGTARANGVTPAGKIIGSMRGPTGIVQPLRAHAFPMANDGTNGEAAVALPAPTTDSARFDANAPKDAIERQFPGAISGARHTAEVDALRDQLTSCMSGMRQATPDAASATAQPQGHQVDGTENSCTTHCGKIANQLDAFHHSSARLASPTRQTYYLRAEDQHQQRMAQLKTQAAACPMGMPAAMPQPSAAGTRAAEATAPHSMDMHPTQQSCHHMHR